MRQAQVAPHPQNTMTSQTVLFRTPERAVHAREKQGIGYSSAPIVFKGQKLGSPLDEAGQTRHFCCRHVLSIS